MVVAAAFLIGIVISWPLWLGARTFPPAPAELLDGLVPLWAQRGTGAVLVCGVAGTLTAALCRSRFTRVLAGATAATFGGLSALDQLRIQPWAYQYALMLGVLAIFPWTPRDRSPVLAVATRGAAAEAPTAVAAIRLIICATYIFSGLSKLQGGFASEALPALLRRSIPELAPFVETHPVVGFGCAALETATGVLLAVGATRQIGRALAVLLHITILALLGPLGANFNHVVWPWNAAMAFLAVWCFRPKSDGADRMDAFLRRQGPWTRQWPNWALPMVVVALPATSFIGVWDQYPSMAVYSGNVATATLEFRTSFEQCLPAQAQALAVSRGRPGSQRRALQLNDWSMASLHVPVYPEFRIFRSTLESLCPCAAEPDALTLIVLSRATLLVPRTVSRFDCAASMP